MDRPMRILHVARVTAPGAEAWNAVTLAKALQEEGHVCWLAGERGTPVLEEAGRQGVRVARGLAIPELRPWNWGQAVTALRTFLKQQRVDLIVVHTGGGHWTAHLARRGLPIPLVRILADAPAPRSDIAHRWLYRHGTDRILIGGAYMRERHLLPLGVERERVAVLPPGIDLTATAYRPEAGRHQVRGDVRADHRIPLGVPLIGILGRMSAVRGHRVLIDAAGHLAAAGRDFRLLVIGGEGELREEDLRAQARPLGIEERLVFTGHIDDPLRYASALDVGVQPAIGPDAPSRPALELMAVGIPVVASLVGVLPELIDEDELLVPPERPEPLAEAIGRLLDDLPWAGRLGERAFKRVQEDYSLAQHGRRATELLLETLHAMRGVPAGEASEA